MVVMRKALAQCRHWRDMNLDLSVAVNLSARNLLDLHLVDDVSAVLEEAGVLRRRSPWSSPRAWS